MEKNYKKITFFLNDEIYDEMMKLLNYRNSRSIALEKDKVRSIEEFVTGSVIHYMKRLKGQETLAGMDDLGSPYRLKNKFKEVMKKKGIRVKDLAEMTNIHAGNISIVTTNRSQPSLDYFLRIWIALGCPPLNECLYRVKEDSDMVDE